VKSCLAKYCTKLTSRQFISQEPLLNSRWKPCLKKIILIYILHIYTVTNYAYLFLIKKKIKHIFFNDTNNVTNIILYNINSYLFEWHKKYGILITKFVIEYNWNRKNQLFSLKKTTILPKKKNYSLYTHKIIIRIMQH